MRALCTTAAQETHIDKLLKLVSSKTIDGGEAWTAFSTPGRSKTFKRKGKADVKLTFTAAEVSTYKKLRQTVQKKLYERCVGLCSYCRKPVGHYGWAWHIEHILPKAKYRADTFKLSNLTVACVHCNSWKGARIDKHVVGRRLSIINPSLKSFNYAQHLYFLQISTEDFSFAKYLPHSPEGHETYRELSFEELERAHAINGLHGLSMGLHDRLCRLMQAGLSTADRRDLVDFLADLKLSIYRK